MLLFGRNKIFKLFEDGLLWKPGETCEAAPCQGRAPDVAFVAVPAFSGEEQFRQYVAALQNESAWLLDGARPKWIQLRGHVSGLPAGAVKSIAQAVCAEPSGVGLDLNPRILEPGDIAGFRAAGVERFCFSMDSPYDRVVDPVRRARALGAFASVEIRLSDELNWLSFMHAVGRALETVPNQISLNDGRRMSAAGAEHLEKAGDRIASAGFRRVSLWAWAKTGAVFDAFGMQLSGRCLSLGPGAFTYGPAAWRNPGLQHWLETRLNGCCEVVRAGDGLEQWLALAMGLYALDLNYDGIEGRLHRHASALKRMGIVDAKGRPIAGRPMEFCHGIARAVELLAQGDPAINPPAGRISGRVHTGNEGMDQWRTGSGGS